RAVRDLAQARDAAADRLVQAARRAQRDARPPARRARRRRVHRERRPHGAGHRLGRARARNRLHRARPRPPRPYQARRRHSAHSAARTKIGAVSRLGARVMTVSYDVWWRALVAHGHPGIGGRFIHPVSDPLVIAGNATIGLEIAEDLSDIETVFVPYGGGGLS